MENHPETLLHVDTPKAIPPYAEFEVAGWVISQQAIIGVAAVLPDGGEIPLALIDRPDVKAAFPNHSHACGFQGIAAGSNIRDNQLVFRVRFAAGAQELRYPLAAPLLPPLGALPEDFPIEPEVKRAKLRRLRHHLQCPICRTALAPQDQACPGCGGKFELTDTVLDFFTPEQRASRPPAEAPVSRGGYDEVMYALIRQHAEGLILDCGAGCKSRLYPNVINLEIAPYDSTDVLAFNETLPFRDGTFDAVFTLATLEHVRDPFQAGSEIMRVLKPGGLVYSMVPLIAPYHGYPGHFYNMTVEGHRNLFQKQANIIDESVPMSGLPIWGLNGILRQWHIGLPPQYREQFADLRVRDLLAHPMEQMQQPYIRYLSPWANLELAGTTRLIAVKR